MKYTSNISEIVRLRVKQLEDLKNPDQLLRAVALGILPEIRKRVHVEGKDTAGGQIGTYSPGYMKVRTGNYQDAAKFKKGVNAGEFKTKKSQSKGEAGKYSQGESKGKSRLVYNRTADTKVILSLTRQMENDLSVVPSPKGYGIGFKNEFNYQKSQWNELMYKKRIWGLTVEEHALAVKIADAYLTDHFNAA